MKKLFPFILLSGLVLSACGSAPGQITGNNRVAIGVSISDVGSTETATRVFTPATDKGPAIVSWTITPGSGVTFTFMTAPGSDAVYITGYRITKQTLTTVNGTNTTTSSPDVNKENLYLTSGFKCSERTALYSCQASDTGMTPSNGLPGTLNIYLEGGLGALAKATNASVSRVTDIQFFGKSSNGQTVTVNADGIVSDGIRAGAE